MMSPSPTFVELVELGDGADRPRRDAGAGTEAVHERFAAVLVALRHVFVGFVDGGDGPGLEHVDVAADHRPLHVLGFAVVVLDALADGDERLDLLVGEHACLALLVGHLALDGLTRLDVLDVHQLLVRDGDLLDLAGIAVHVVVVRGDRAGDDRLAEPPRRLDDGLVGARRGWLVNITPDFSASTMRWTTTAMSTMSCSKPCSSR